MNHVIDACPPILFDNRLNKIDSPDEMQIGDLFYISQNELLASGETVKNPFDIGPGLFDIPGIQNTGIAEPDLLLVRATEIHDEHHGIGRVEAEIDNEDEVLSQYETNEDILSDHNYNIRDHVNPVNQRRFQGSLNELIKDK